MRFRLLALVLAGVVFTGCAINPVSGRPEMTLISQSQEREIGRELYLSVNTIKTHTRSIYTKLDAASRTEAIARARSLGLIA